ncbi:hypothetical protein BOSE62_40484 [Bosea sp. 62]|nr:hypothetical protein BOSE46_120301 [Bosea sp. 46]CAD5261185.1 hypothetical protein BOSE21B_110523 [Bosea sp. 21B]CAD5279446.1 hypothetical protein BOSE7B_40694 [Bosea sp. 7B]VVT58415.1 hypothetical protein BOS5A_200574 [Bosea sp. EC-HK365B]VXB53517.1 hypothetical protein BOSE29B_110466 [Bosea sp. 29B]VXB95534.1 hypothetical protein BOSE125_160258 [Bosea sp. 125]VXC46006.1 hypothetical protein BOSE62_40484 [Bosea sp. 62]VXC82995.1 hypothetical protein BOSE127_60092 [Bosea sp. 127]
MHPSVSLCGRFGLVTACFISEFLKQRYGIPPLTRLGDMRLAASATPVLCRVRGKYRCQTSSRPLY